MHTWHCKMLCIAPGPAIWPYSSSHAQHMTSLQLGQDTFISTWASNSYALQAVNRGGCCMHLLTPMGGMIQVRGACLVLIHNN